MDVFELNVTPAADGAAPGDGYDSLGAPLESARSRCDSVYWALPWR